MDLEDYLYQYDSLDKLVEQSNHERDLANRRYEKNIDRIKIYFSLIAISTSIIFYGLINLNALTARIQFMNLDPCDWIIVSLFIVLFLYFFIRSLALIGLALANNEYRLSLINADNMILGLKFARDVYGFKENSNDGAYRKIQQYVSAKLIDHSTNSIIKGNNHIRLLIADSMIQLVRAISLAVLFLPYLIIDMAEENPWTWALCIPLLFFFLVILLRDSRNIIKLIRAIFIPVRKSDYT